MFIRVTETKTEIEECFGKCVGVVFKNPDAERLNVQISLKNQNKFIAFLCSVSCWLFLVTVYCRRMKRNAF